MKIAGIILIVLGAVAFVMSEGGAINYSEVGTVRGIGGGALGLGAILLVVGLTKKKA